MTLQLPFPVKFMFAMNHVHSIPRDSPREGGQQSQQISTPQQSLDRPRDPGNYQQHQNQLPVSTARQQHQISISFQLPPPDSSIKSASASTTRQQYKINISFQLLQPCSSTKSASASSFHHQAATPNQHQLPASTTRQQHYISQPPAKHPANQLLTLLPCHTHIMAARSVVV